MFAILSAPRPPPAVLLVLSDGTDPILVALGGEGHRREHQEEADQESGHAIARSPDQPPNANSGLASNAAWNSPEVLSPEGIPANFTSSQIVCGKDFASAGRLTVGFVTRKLSEPNQQDAHVIAV